MKKQFMAVILSSVIGVTLIGGAFMPAVTAATNPCSSSVKKYVYRDIKAIKVLVDGTETSTKTSKVRITIYATKRSKYQFCVRYMVTSTMSAPYRYKHMECNLVRETKKSPWNTSTCTPAANLGVEWPWQGPLPAYTGTTTRIPVIFNSRLQGTTLDWRTDLTDTNGVHYTYEAFAILAPRP